jgi:biopolymer transport protein TolQ
MSPLDFLLFSPPVVLLAQTRRSWLGVDVVDALRDTDPVGWLCLISLFVLSVMSWAIIAFNILHVRQAHRQTRQFVSVCSNSGKLEDAFRHAASFPDSPLAQLARETFSEIQAENWYQSAAAAGVSHHLEVAKISLERVHDRTITREISHLESWLIFLATTAAISPFIGLFGTVWGILGVFQALAAHSSASLQVIAPGIATALTTTIAGLLAAIPAVVSYNYLTNSIQILINRMDAFALELSNIVQKHILS